MPPLDAGLLIIAWLGFAAIAVAVMVFIIGRRRLRERLYGGRRHLDAAEYYERYFSDSDVDTRSVEGVLNAFKNGTPLDFSRIDPDERFDERINEFLTVDDWEDVAFYIDDELKISTRHFQPSDTARELIYHVDAEVKR